MVNYISWRSERYKELKKDNPSWTDKEIKSQLKEEWPEAKKRLIEEEKRSQNKGSLEESKPKSEKIDKRIEIEETTKPNTPEITDDVINAEKATQSAKTTDKSAVNEVESVPQINNQGGIISIDSCRFFIKALFETIEVISERYTGKKGIWELADFELSNLANTATPVINKYAAEWMKRYPQEIMLTVTAGIIVAPRIMRTVGGMKKSKEKAKDSQEIQSESQDSKEE